MVHKAWPTPIPTSGWGASPYLQWVPAPTSHVDPTREDMKCEGPTWVGWVGGAGGGPWVVAAAGGLQVRRKNADRERTILGPL